MKFKLPSSIKSRGTQNLQSRKNDHFQSQGSCDEDNKHQEFVDCTFRQPANRAVFSSRKLDNIFKTNLNDSDEVISHNKTIDLEDIQKEVESVKARMKLNNKRRILDPNRFSKDAIQMKNREMTDNFIKHTNKKQGNLFETQIGNLSPFKLGKPEVKMDPLVISHEQKP